MNINETIVAHKLKHVSETSVFFFMYTIFLPMFKEL